MRRNLGGHTDGNAGGTIEQYKRQACRHELGLSEGAVIVGQEVDGATVKLGQKQLGDGRQAALGVTHRCRAVPVARAEVALAIYQWVTQREVLGNAHHRVIYAGIAVRVIFTNYIAHHACRLDVLGRRRQPHLVHRIKNAPLYRLETVFDLGQGA